MKNLESILEESDHIELQKKGQNVVVILYSKDGSIDQSLTLEGTDFANISQEISTYPNFNIYYHGIEGCEVKCFRTEESKTCKYGILY